jgi:steroid delta-isomerase-like uncharacterized protein
MGEAAELARKYLACVDARDAEQARPLLADDYTYTGGDGETRQGPQAAVDVMAMYLGAFEDMSLEIRAIHEAGNVAVTEFIGRGTHTGELQGIAPTGKRIEMPICNIIEVRDGKIVAEREYFDQMTLMAQLGLVPEATPA